MHKMEITKEQFEEFIKKGNSFVLHFWADWNGYDLEQKDIIHAVCDKYPDIQFYEMNVDVEDNHEVCLNHHVAGPPTVVFYSKGKLINHNIGVMNEKCLNYEIQKIKIA